MKALIILFLGLFLSIAYTGTINGQTVPKAVKAKFHQLYPKAEKVKWDKEDTKYEANFKLNNVEMSTLFNNKGNLLETETSIAKKDLPVLVMKSINKNFPGYPIVEVDKIVRKRNVIYEVDFKKGEKYVGTTFDSKGKLLKKEIRNGLEGQD